jgi:hypothetical protein
MQADLPVEVRDLIYHHMWDKSTITSFPDLSRVAGGAACVDEICDCDIPHGTPTLPHFIKPDFMGKITAREIVRALYEGFHFTKEHLTVRLPNYLQRAVMEDVFQVGLVPGSHLRSLILRIKLDRLRKPRSFRVPTKPRPADKVYTQRAMFKGLLKPLLYIQCKANFELHITLFQRNVRVAVIQEVLEALTDVRQALQNRHARVKIYWEYRGNWYGGNNTRPEVSSIREMDDYFAVPRKAWKDSAVRFLIEVSVLSPYDKLY